ncbi:MAG: hypothetical protein HC848_07625 [Limnobacter sp.]|nr:hypothetical protein [Limnobacter sp.]
MSIRAPFQCSHYRSFAPASLEREMFYETMGSLWALSAKNINGQFVITLLTDLSHLTLLYGKPTEHLPEELLSHFLQLFKMRALPSQNARELLENNATQLLAEMSMDDFLNFNAGFHDAVEQILEVEEFWSDPCSESFMNLKYSGMNLLESHMKDVFQKARYARALTKYIEVSQKACAHQVNTSYPSRQ